MHQRPVRAVGRREAAGGHRPRARQGAAAAVRRRAHLGARRRERPDGDAPAAPRRHGARRGGDLRHPRPAAGSLRRPRRPPRGRPHPDDRAAAHCSASKPRPSLSEPETHARVPPSPDRLGRHRRLVAPAAGGALSKQAAAKQQAQGRSPPPRRQTPLRRPSPTARPTSTAASSRSPPAPPASSARCYVQEGDAVTKGQVLARQEDDEPRLAVETAEASWRQAEAADRADRRQLAHRRARVRPAAAAGRRATSSPAKRSTRRTTPCATPTPRSGRSRPRSASPRPSSTRPATTLDLTIIRAPVDGQIVRRYANPGVGASTLNVTHDVRPRARPASASSAPRSPRATCPSSSSAGRGAGRRRPTRPRSIPARCCAAPACSARASCSRTTPPQRTDDRVVEVVVSADGAPFLIGQRVLVKFMKHPDRRSAARGSRTPLGRPRAIGL